MKQLVDMPYDLLEYSKCQSIINQIIDNWFENQKELIDQEYEKKNFIKTKIANCMISYRRLMHDKLEL